METKSASLITLMQLPHIKLTHRRKCHKVSHEIIYMLPLCSHFSHAKTRLFGAHHLINHEMRIPTGITQTHTHNRPLLPKDKAMQEGQMIVVCVCLCEKKRKIKKKKKQHNVKIKSSPLNNGLIDRPRKAFIMGGWGGHTRPFAPWKTMYSRCRRPAV